MNIVYCSKCGCSNDANNQNCISCGEKLHGASDYNNTYTNNMNYNNQFLGDNKKNVSTLSIVAFVLSFIPCLGLIGLVLAIIDVLKKDGHKKIFSYLTFGLNGLLFIILIIFILLVGTSDLSTDSSDSSLNHVNESVNDEIDYEENVINEAIEIEEATEVEEVEKEESVAEGTVENVVDKDYVTATDASNMSLGDVAKSGEIYIGLSYAKRMSYLPLALDQKEEVADGNEVILAFFEFLNDSGKAESISPMDVSCYADGVIVEDVETYIKVNCDGIGQFYNEELAGNKKAISVQDFEVPKGWEELKFFYKSKCVWVLHQDDVKDEPFELQSIYDYDVEETYTEDGSLIYSGDIEIISQGKEKYIEKNSYWGDSEYIIFKFTINNIGSETVDYSLAGHNMHGYQGGYLLDSADYTLDKKIDGYSNIFNIDSIEPGMSANIYVAFDSNGLSGDCSMIYDDGYIISSEKGYVCFGE